MDDGCVMRPCTTPPSGCQQAASRPRPPASAAATLRIRARALFRFPRFLRRAAGPDGLVGQEGPGPASVARRAAFTTAASSEG